MRDRVKCETFVVKKPIFVKSGYIQEKKHLRTMFLQVIFAVI